MNGKTPAAPEPSRPAAATVAARLSTDAATAQRIGDALGEHFDADALAASAFEEPDGRWSLAIHFRDQPDEAAVRAVLASAAGIDAARALAFETLAPTDWVRKSLEGLKPVEAGRFVVHGAHDRARVRANRLGIEIEAALAFGTGHHGSTRGCLLALHQLAKGRKRKATNAPPVAPPSKKGRKSAVLDVGTGTGVLAIAAARTLRAPVLASDIDRRAVTIARDNARKNGVGTLVQVIGAAGLGVAQFRACAPYDLIVANILLEPLRGLATPMARLVVAGQEAHLLLPGVGVEGPAVAEHHRRPRAPVLVVQLRLVAGRERRA